MPYCVLEDVTDAKAKKIGVKAATRMVALGHVTGNVTHFRMRRSAKGIHVWYTLPVPGGKGLKVSSFCPRQAIKIRVRWTP